MFRKVRNVRDNKNFKAKKAKELASETSFSGIRVARVPNKISAVQIPENIGIVKDSYRGLGDKLIIHIQDAHCNYEAQNNIYEMIKILVDQNKVKLLCVEGSEGLIDVAPFASFPDKKVKQEVADFFVKKGRITGPEYYAITSEKDVELFGIEDRSRYLDNLNAFKKTMPYRPRFESVISKITNIFEKLKPKIYNRALLLMDSKEKAYDDEKLTFTKYCDFLINLAKKYKFELEKYKNLKHFSLVSKYEDKIDFDKIEAERGKLINVMREPLYKRFFSELVLKTTMFRNGKLTSGEYHSHIIKLARNMKKEKMSDYKNLVNYAKYMIAYESIEHDLLLREKEQLLEDLEMFTFENKEQKLLCHLAKVLKKIDGFYQLEMSRDDLAFYERKIDLFSFSKFLSFIGTYAPRYNVSFDLPSNIVELDNFYQDFLSYYGFAKDRDLIMNNKTIQRMEETNQKIAVQVCGGFHTDGMTQQLKDKKISYVVLSPRITKDDPNNPYLDILLGRSEPFDTLFQEEKRKAREKKREEKRKRYERARKRN